MSRRLCQGVGALVLGAAFLVAAGLAGASRGFAQGGIFRVGYAGASVQIDPQLAYVSTAWSLEYATAAKLFNYPDRAGAAGGVLRPEVAAGYKVSRDGRVYTFTIRRGFRFNDGTPVTAKSFAYAIDRVANYDLASPGAPFITDPNGTDILGARAVNAGKATHVSGVVAKGNRLVIRLTRRDPTLLTKLAMPFFQATSLRLPLAREVVGAYPSAGPYAFTRNTPNVLTELRRNTYYRGLRPRNLTGVDVWWNLDQQAGYRQVEAGSLEEGPLPDAEVRAVARRFGVNKSRFWVEPINCVGYVALNSGRRLFRNNVALRQAINWMIDRRAALAPLAPYSASPWTHLLPPTVPGSITAKKLQPYRAAPDARKARRLAAGHLRAGLVNIGYRSTASAGLAQARYIRDVLVKLGIQAGRIKLKAFAGADLYDAMRRQNGDLDLGVGLGWCSDYPEPLGLLTVAFSGLGSAARGQYQGRLDVATKLQGKARLRALGRLDLDLMNTLAPVAVTSTYNNRFYFSRRVEPKSLVYVGVYQDWSIPALALK
jgi:ABC-type oligopeptide transport system substrate-binding subunit